MPTLTQKLCCLLGPFLAQVAEGVAVDGELTLDHWSLQSSAKLGFAGGAAISQPSFDASAWYNASVPCTVLACLVQNGLYPDLYQGMNFALVDAGQFNASWWYRVVLPSGAREWPSALLTFEGVNYRANVWCNGRQIGNAASTVGTFRYFDFLLQDLSNESDNIVAVEVVRPTDRSLPPSNHDTDLAISFVDWAPQPPDYGMGLWQKVKLLPIPIATHQAREAVSSSPQSNDKGSASLVLLPRYPQVSTVLSAAAPTGGYPAPDSSGDVAAVTAHLSVLVQVFAFAAGSARNPITDSAATSGSELQTGTLRCSLLPPTAATAATATEAAKFEEAESGGWNGCQMEAAVAVAAGASVQVVFSNSTVACLNAPAPALWWPWQMGPPTLHSLHCSVEPSQAPVSLGGSLEMTASVGLRQVDASLDDNGHLLFRVNGNRLLVRGGGYAPDLMLRPNTTETDRLMSYSRHMGLNVIRMEGKFDGDAFFQAADEAGMLVLVGWCCCDAWQHWPYWGPEQHTVATASLRDQLRRLRVHPSVAAFLYGSDINPPDAVEKEYLSVFAAEQWPNPHVASAAADVSNITGSTGVKMNGPYAWVPPNYWLADTIAGHGPQMGGLGGAWGFSTEISPGASPMTLENHLATVGVVHEWPEDSVWDYHCGSTQGLFGSLKYFKPPTDSRLGPSNGAEEFLYKAQLMAYESHRAMFEGYAKNKYVASTGVVQWMLNNAFPQHMWHLFDRYGGAGGAFYGVTAAHRPLHLMYSYNDSTVWLVNSQYDDNDVNSRVDSQSDSLTVTVEIWDPVKASLLANTSYATSAPLADSSQSIGAVPRPPGETSLYLLRLLLLHASSGDVVDSSVYWLNAKHMDKLDWDSSNFYITPCSKYADLTGLAALPPVQLKGELLPATPATPTAAAAAAAAAAAVGKGEEGVAFTVRVSNPTASVAFFIRLVLVKGDGQEVQAALFDRNYITLMPREQAEVGVLCLSCSAGGTPPALRIESYNNAVPSP